MPSSPPLTPPLRARRSTSCRPTRRCWSSGRRRAASGTLTPSGRIRVKLTIHHLYADMMDRSGGRGNVIAINKRAEWPGIAVEVVDVGLKESMRPTSSAELFLFGGGQDRGQALLAEDLS